MNEKKFYITTTLPYVNADPHIGFALELVQADVIARYFANQGADAFFNTGTDEHGIKVFNAAKENGVDINKYAEDKSSKFKKLAIDLNISQNVENINFNFIRTTDPNHENAAKEFWKKCSENGDIEKKIYKAKYCNGCELEKTDSELENGCCPLHPNLEIEIIEEENYFFKFSNYKNELLKLYEKKDFVIPNSRQNEIRKFIESGPKDFSISRLKEKLPWGVEVPDDPAHVMYVWFDALVNYISAIGWPDDMDKFNSWWPAVQIAGKDNLRQQSAMWQAMLMSAKVETSKQIIIHGFITSGGKKMSKSMGNVIDPFQIIEKYGTDSLRYYLLREINTFEDGDFTEEHFRETYNANLANGIGNLVSRIMKMSSEHMKGPPDSIEERVTIDHEVFARAMDNYNLKAAIDQVWVYIAKIDSFIQRNEPFVKIKSDKEQAIKDITTAVNELWTLSSYLYFFMPETSEKIKEAIKSNKMPKPLFERLT